MNHGIDNRQRAFLRNFPDALAYHYLPPGSEESAESYVFAEVNSTFEDLVGIRKDNMIGKKITEVLPVISALDFDWLETYEKVSRKGTEVRFEYYSKPLERWYKITASADGEGGFFTVFRDITEYKEKEDALELQFELERLFSEVSSYFVSLPARELSEGINHALKMIGEFFKLDCALIYCFLDDHQSMKLINHWFKEEPGQAVKDLSRIKCESVPWWVSKTNEKEHLCVLDIQKLPPEAETEKEIFRALNLKSVVLMPVICDSRICGSFLLGSKESWQHWNAEHESCLSSISELVSCAISRHRAFSEIYYKSYHDHLTGLYNRSYLEKELERNENSNRLPVTIIKADINSLKLVNDAYGHRTGDKLLKKVAWILQKTCREEDIIARWGGDEFVVILPQTTKEAAQVLYERIKNSCMEAFMKDVPVSIAIGLATKETREKKLHETLEEAESDMYKQKLAESRSTRSAILNSLLTTLGAKSYETEVHFRQMRSLARYIGKKIKLHDSELDRLNLLVTLHDIGKINIPEEVLTKEKPLTLEEWKMIEKHPETGYRIARSTGDFALVAVDILGHHERWDGSGYPQGLKGGKIPLLSRITSIVDAYEVMSRGRPYKRALSQEEIVAEFTKCAGKQFDPQLVEILFNVLQENGFVELSG